VKLYPSGKAYERFMVALVSVGRGILVVFVSEGEWPSHAQPNIS
jgi:hypothetical protein